MRKTVAVALMLALMASLCSCSPLVNEATEQELTIYASFYPIYAISAMLMRDIPNIKLYCLARPQDGCLRSYELSYRDLYLLAYSADAVIIGGRGLESYESTLYALGEEGPAVVAALINMELHNQDDNAASEESESHLTGANPHLYMSVDGAMHMIEALRAYMSELDPMYMDEYADNMTNSLSELEALKAEMSAAVARMGERRVILMNEALIYLAQQLELETACCIDRESAEDMDSAALAEAIAEMRASGANVALIEKQAPLKLVNAIRDAGFAVALIDIMSTGREDMGYEGYFTAQRRNAANIAEAFKSAGGGV